ncbi:MAG: hypothetical protein GXX99_06735 [Clostridiales bacterium]|nr:hypothetical protein [Clostridiales bacterium]
MSRLAFLAKRLVNMNYGGMAETVGEVARRSGRSRAAVAADMAACALRYQSGYLDYQLFQFDRLSPAQRASYITRGVNNAYVRSLNPREDWPLLDDKALFLQHFDGWHGRAWLDLRSAGAGEFADFCAAHPQLVGKPYNGTCGRGIAFYEAAGAEPELLRQTLLEQGQVLVEERVEQHGALAALHPASVNTLRLVTIRSGERVQTVFRCLRIGNGKPVDNLGSGGMCALVDGQGCISTPGADKNGRAHEVHPLTGHPLQGTQLPFFAEALALVEAAALRTGGLRYVGWDVATTARGPILIEGNQFPDHQLYQFPIHLGPDRMGLAPRFAAAIGGREG